MFYLISPSHLFFRFQNPHCLCIQVGKIFQKFGESRSAFEVVKESLEGDSGADEDGGAAHDVRVGVDDALVVEGFLDVHDGGPEWWLL
jgi:hypothetical protein